MSSIIVKAGNNIPLHHQLGEYDIGKFVEVILKSDTGTAYSIIDLVDRGDGLYTYDTPNPMPSFNLIGTYKTYDNALKTVESSDQSGLDIFILNDFTESTTRNDKIIGILETNNALTGSIESATIVGNIDSQEIIGSIVNQNDLSVEIQTAEITASFKCL